MPYNSNDNAPNKLMAPTVVTTHHTLVHGLWIPAQLQPPVDILIVDSMDGRTEQINALLNSTMWGFEYVADRTHILYHEWGAVSRMHNIVASRFTVDSVYRKALLMGIQDGIVTSISTQMRQRVWQAYFNVPAVEYTKEWWSMAL